MLVSKQRGFGRLGALGLALSLAACALPAEPPAGPVPTAPEAPAEIGQAPGKSAPELWFSLYGSGLVTPRWSHTADVIGNWLYVVGGADTEGQMASVERAPILAGGELGAFRPAGSTLRVHRDCHASLRVGNWLYVFGGDQRGSLDSVERAPITSSGDLGDFEMAGTRLEVARDEHTATRIGRYVYVIGGIRGPVQLNSLERAEVLADGRLGPFTRYGRTLTANRYGHWVEVRGEYLYVVAGLSDNGDAGLIERAKILPDGELGPFVRLGSRLLENRDSPIAIGLNGWLYVIAGARENAMHIKLTSVEAAPFEGSGLGAFVPAGALREGRDYHTVTRVGSWIYAIAGEKTNGGALASVERARVPDSAPVGKLKATPTPQPTAAPTPAGWDYPYGGGDYYDYY
jgi:hypothetical protein